MIEVSLFLSILLICFPSFTYAKVVGLSWETTLNVLPGMENELPLGVQDGQIIRGDFVYETDFGWYSGSNDGKIRNYHTYFWNLTLSEGYRYGRHYYDELGGIGRGSIKIRNDDSIYHDSLSFGTSISSHGLNVNEYLFSLRLEDHDGNVWDTADEPEVFNFEEFEVIKLSIHRIKIGQPGSRITIAEYWSFPEINLRQIGANVPSVADAGMDEVVYAWVDGIAEVKLDGSGSYDADGDTLEYFWFVGDEQIATGVDPNVQLSVGEHIIELIVNDGSEDSEPNAVVITVIEPVEAGVHIVPRAINRNNRLKRVMAIIRLPEGIGKGDVVRESFELYAGGLDGEPVGAILERVVGRGDMTRVVALFDKGEVMNAVDAVEGVDRVDLTVELTVVGRLESGQYIYGSDTVRIARPRRQRGRLRRGR